jgi:hypothetical protein
MKCPSCKKCGAYVGFNIIECENKQCFHYKYKNGNKPGKSRSLSEILDDDDIDWDFLGWVLTDD